MSASTAVSFRLPELTARRMETSRCVSGARACYTETVRPGLWVPDLRWSISDAVMEAEGGHNGILVEADSGDGCHLDPDRAEKAWIGLG